MPQQSIYSEWLARDHDLGRTLVQHVAWWVPDFAAAFRMAGERGYQAILHGASAQGGFAYFQHPASPEFNMEITELTPARTKKYELVAQAAAQWDGSEPARFL